LGGDQRHAQCYASVQKLSSAHPSVLEGINQLNYLSLLHPINRLSQRGTYNFFKRSLVITHVYPSGSVRS
jgi:hypothetical protein